jgi:hypothetical protein
MIRDSHVAKTATVKNLFDSSLAGDTKQRIMELHHHSQRLWGTMTVAQTLAHCTSSLEMAMGVNKPKRAPFPANVMGLLIKPLVFGNDKPMRRSGLRPAPTSFLWSTQTAAVGHFTVQTHRSSFETVRRLKHNDASGLSIKRSRKRRRATFAIM